MRRNKEKEPEYVISQRAVDALRANEAAPRAERPDLSRDNIEEFLQLVSQIQPPSLFKRKLGMNAADIEFYKRTLDIDNEDDARQKLRVMRHEDEVGNERDVIQNRLEQQAAERLANERLDTMERERIERAAHRDVPDIDAIREDEAQKRQRFEAEQQQAKEALKSNWRLPLEGPKTAQGDQIDLFRRDLVHRGMRFCLKKYNCSSRDIKAEAIRLGLKINWDILPR